MANHRTPLGVLADLDPASVLNRPITAFEQRLIDDLAQNVWVLAEYNNQPVVKDWVGGTDGRYFYVARGHVWLDVRCIDFTGSHHYVVIPYDTFDVANATYEVAVGDITAAGTVFSRKGFFDVDVVDNTTVRLAMVGETDIDASVNVMDGGYHTLAVVFTATTYDLYVDGVATGVLTFAGAVPTTGNDVYVGREEDDSTTSFRGLVSHLSFFPSVVVVADLLYHFYLSRCYNYALVELTILDPGFESGDFGNGWAERNEEARIVTSYEGGTIPPYSGTYMAAGYRTSVGGDYMDIASDEYELDGDFDISDADVDEGTTTLTMKVWLRGDTDDCKVGFRFMDDASVLVSQVWSARTSYNSWTLYTYAQAIPATSRRVQLLLAGYEMTSGAFLSALFDDVQLFKTRVCP